MLEQRNFYINGAWVAPARPNDLAVIDPSTEEPFAVISLGDRADTDAAVAAARAAFPGWAATPPAERKAALARVLEVYQTRAEDLAQAMSREMGAPIELARGSQVGAGVSHLGNFLAAFDKMVWDQPFGDTPGARLIREPVGVVGLITPWNWPLNQITLKVGAALLAGCTMVLKPSEIAPLSAMVFAEIMHDAGLPPGVFNLVNGDGAGVGTQLSTHPDVEMISFTGSTRAGIAITRNAAETLKKVTLELGGKGANLIFADADPDAVKRGLRHCFQNSGQSCNAPTRMLVERAAYDQAVETARQLAEATPVGPASEEGRHIGPVVSHAQYEKIQALIETGLAEGARLVAGGPGRPEALNRGYFVRPTVFADVTPHMTIAREEIFGPVLSILPFDTEDEAVAIANDTPYGLTNYAQTSDPARLTRLARALRAGMVELNGQPRGPGAPFGGIRASGRAREGGLMGIEEFTEVKSVSGVPDA
ncbi:aldehyde dehydrogenase family protein [Phaeovulum vinaykumarii]|uniref:aldehyde dehydrogenase (NAD(+)) n=1 Tax=Phaeovulum vinaykumarii TaxID=407234 RepID=A0A1N7KQR0_9RHOB|nr:aldehyde dehydrogenase family protein [Phaeovulum vinaykumarii]SIS63836.1 aldehyde dehydrogenase (NAD+) [Phaeovulum vinaykumarii]SOC01765.1 aldehyde dehydrogenase (NAD+) [Phaeovulum vinaykumarii]